MNVEAYYKKLRGQWVFDGEDVLHLDYACLGIPQESPVTILWPTGTKVEDLQFALNLLRSQRGNDASWCRQCCVVPRYQVKCVTYDDRGLVSLRAYDLDQETDQPKETVRLALWNAEYRLHCIHKEDKVYHTVDVHEKDRDLSTNPDGIKGNNLEHIARCTT